MNLTLLFKFNIIGLDFEAARLSRRHNTGENAMPDHDQLKKEAKLFAKKQKREFKKWWVKERIDSEGYKIIAYDPSWGWVSAVYDELISYCKKHKLNLWVKTETFNPGYRGNIYYIPYNVYTLWVRRNHE